MINLFHFDPHFTISIKHFDPKKRCQVEPNCYAEKVAPGDLAKPQANEPEVYDEVYREADYQWWGCFHFRVHRLETPPWLLENCWEFFLDCFFLFWGVQRNRFMVFLKMVKVRKWRRCLLIFSLKRGIGGHHFFRYDTSRKSNRSWLHKSQPCLQRPWCFQIQLSPSPRGPKCCPLWIHPLDGSERKTVGPRDLLGVPCWKVWGVSVKTTMFELTGRFIQTEGNQVKQISSRFGFGSWRGLGLSNVSICIACCTAARWVPRESWMVS